MSGELRCIVAANPWDAICPFATFLLPFGDDDSFRPSLTQYVRNLRLAGVSGDLS